MRFLFGIFTGAALTLLVATATDAPTSPVVNQLSATWQELISATGDRLFRSSATDGVTPPELERRAQRRTHALMPPAEESSVNEPLPAGEPEKPKQTQPEAPGVSAAANNTDSLLELPAPTPASPPAIEPQLAQTTSPAPATEDTPAGDQLAAVWVPFHSERSADGFARSLSRHFEYPFSVRRAGPGAYQVIFAYASSDQRENMLMEIAELTGQ
jgi:hypothetical protein